MLSSLSLLAKIPRLVVLAVLFLIFNHFDILCGSGSTIDTCQNVVDEMAKNWNSIATSHPSCENVCPAAENCLGVGLGWCVMLRPQLLPPVQNCHRVGRARQTESALLHLS